MNAVRFFVILTMLALLPATGHAKWWIFGQAENEISTRYLYLNGVSYDELGDKVTIYRETLENGQVILRGKAATSSSAVGSVQVSTTNRESWEKARKTSDGSFEYAFRPETGTSYVLYVKIIDTTGKTNDVDATRKEIVISDRNISALIRQALDELVAAYRAEDPTRFMALVSEDFAADPAVLDRAIRRDFTAFDNIDLSYTLNNVTAANGKIYAGFTFSRKLTSTRSGQTLSDKGSSEFIFSLGEKGPLVFSMKNPLIFGLSDASNVATGTVNTGTNEPVIVVTSSGDVITQPFTEAITTIDNGGVVQTTADTVEAGSFTLSNSCPEDSCIQPGFLFSSQEVTNMWTGDINLEINLMFIKSGIGIQNLGAVGINTVTSAPASGYVVSDGTGLTGFIVGDNIGNTFAFQLLNGKYALLEVVSYTDLGAAKTRSTFRYKYQPDGTRNF
ncbi:hypothetical protein KIP69_12965 [Geobacter sulfurreducens]|uniref:hypothetical protein n=1 Tax=Geobacter sulfurreducens TaxID=35554 RepID=UPI0001D8F3C4|nr:hypothetical protein [Geobacter sulfurreducens]ADI85425.1 hypothetical protein KN400_2613 [Geobacter sulfurreducens KN400]AJY68966.1 hypothetical protein RW64_04805 [Geobacter sulfurreducens]QVW34496.1 hypothetical protein KIP69_12965 [Geobacter sulfurreducens]